MLRKKRDSSETPANRSTRTDTDRRRLIAGTAGIVASSLALPASAAKKRKPEKLPPQPGDQLAFPSYQGDGQAITADDVVVGAAPLLVYPRDPVSGVLRERSRLNQILVMRFDTADLNDALAPFAAEGVLAYSGVCTHTACGVSEWDAEARHLVCPCHGSSFDPLNKGKRMTGPATRSLPLLPIKKDDAHFAVAGTFSAKVGPKK